MAYIVSYQKHIDSIRTVEIRLPEDVSMQRIGTELATINGVTYVSLPDNTVLPEQPAEITVAAVDLTPDLKQSISDASPHVKLIRQRVSDKIAERYSTGDEIKLIRTAPSAEFEAYNAYAEDCRAWGRAERAKLGL